MSKKKKGWRLRRYYKYYWLFYSKERITQTLVFILNICIIIILEPFAFIKEFVKDLWGCKSIFVKIPTRKAMKEKLIELKLE